MKKWKMAILGTGTIAGTMARTIAEMEHVERYAVASRSMEKAERFAQEHGFAKAYGSYEELARDEAVSYTHLTLPTT